MPAYTVARAQVTDWERYGEHTRTTPAAIERFGGRFMVPGSEMITLERSQETGWVTLNKRIQQTVLSGALILFYSIAFAAPHYRDKLPGRQGRVATIAIGFGGDYQQKMKQAAEHLETAGAAGVDIACLPGEFAGTAAEPIPGPTTTAIGAFDSGGPKLSFSLLPVYVTWFRISSANLYPAKAAWIPPAIPPLCLFVSLADASLFLAEWKQNGRLQFRPDSNLIINRMISLCRCPG